MDKASHFLFEYLFYTRERRRSEVLKSERPSGEPTCPLNHHAAHRWRGSRNGGDRSWEVKTLHTRHGNRRRCLFALEPTPRYRGLMPPPPPRVGVPFHPLPSSFSSTGLGVRVTQRDDSLSDHSDHAEGAGDQICKPIALSGLNYAT